MSLDISVKTGCACTQTRSRHFKMTYTLPADLEAFCFSSAKMTKMSSVKALNTTPTLSRSNTFALKLMGRCSFRNYHNLRKFLFFPSFGGAASKYHGSSVTDQFASTFWCKPLLVLSFEKRQRSAELGGHKRRNRFFWCISLLKGC